MDLSEKEFRHVWKLAVEKQYIPVRRKSERELWIAFDNGSFIECRSEENPDQLIGEGLDLVVLAEAARLKQRTWDQYIRPAIADRQGKALFTSTPRGFNWFYDFYERGQNSGEFPGWESWMIPSSANPILPPEEIEEAKRTTSPEAFAQEWEAKFIAYGGLVFPEFSENIHVKERGWNPNLKSALWVDPGGSAPYAVLLVQITPDEHVYVYDEIYSTGRVTPEVIDLAEFKWRDKIMDDDGRAPRSDLQVIVDEAAQEAVGMWRLRGYQAGGKKPKIKQGIEVHHQFLKDPRLSTENKIVPKILFSPRCRNCIREHGSYHYPDEARKRVETNKSELPVDVDNHTIDALRYGYFNNFPNLFNISPPSESLIQGELEQFLPDFKRVRLDDGEPFEPDLRETGFNMERLFKRISLD
jgi:Terminase large subunit, T4likevirus-type, N-terminal